MAALAGVMIMVSISTFDWSSLRTLHIVPKTDVAVMVVTVSVVVYTHDLSQGVLAGVVLSALFFAAKISKVKVMSLLVDEGHKRIYYIRGQIFFASVTEFLTEFDFQENIDEVELDFTAAHLWDDSAAGAIDKIQMKFAQNQTKVIVKGLNIESTDLMDKIGGISNNSGH